MEIWKSIKDYENYYEVSTLGYVKSIKYNKILKPYVRPDGYATVVLCKNGKKKTYRVHRLVAETFIPNPKKLSEINHKDENKLNNKTSNLEWCTSHYNKNYGTRNQKCMIMRGTPVKCIETR